MKTNEIELCPTQTPWGHAQHIEKIAAGVWSVSTAGHGGLYVAPWKLNRMPVTLSAPTPYSSGGWFEEDCDWALVCAAFPELFDSRMCWYALSQAEHSGEYLRERWKDYLGSPLAAMLRERAAAHKPESELATV